MKTVQSGNPASPALIRPSELASFHTLPLIEPSVGVKSRKFATVLPSLATVTFCESDWPGERFQSVLSTCVTLYVPTVIDGNEYAPAASVRAVGSPTPGAPSPLRSRNTVQSARPGSLG